MVNSYAPPGESSFELWNERAVLNGLFLGSVAYGVHLTLFIWCFRLLLQKNNKNRRDWFQMIFISLLFALGSVGNGLNTKVAEDAFINKRNYPGGPGRFYNQGGEVVSVTCDVVYIINLWFQDGLLLWRFWMFFAHGGRWYVAIIPSLMFLTSFGLSLALVITISMPGNTLWDKISTQLAIPYWAISIALNVIITTSIAAKLLHMRNKIRKLVGGGNEYASVTSILVESAALYTSNALIFLVSYAVNSPATSLATPVLGQTQCIAPLLIILRVLQGRAWSSAALTKFEAEITSLRFNVGISEATHDSSPALAEQSIEKVEAQTTTR